MNEENVEIEVGNVDTTVEVTPEVTETPEETFEVEVPTAEAEAVVEETPVA